MFAAAVAPEEKEAWSLRSWGERVFKGNREQETKLPFCTLVSCGNRTPLGWDHTNMKWYYPIWPELDDKLGLPSEESKMRWRLDWEDENGHDSETSGPGTSFARPTGVDDKAKDSKRCQ